MCVCEGKRWEGRGRGREDKMSLGGKEKTTYSYFQDIGKDDDCVSVDSREPPEVNQEAPVLREENGGFSGTHMLVLN